MGPIAPMPERTGTFDGVAALAPVVTFSLVLHHSVPQIVAPVKVRSEFDKRAVRRAFIVLACSTRVRRAGGLLIREKTQSAANWAGPRPPRPRRGRPAGCLKTRVPRGWPNSSSSTRPSTSSPVSSERDHVRRRAQRHRRFQANGEVSRRRRRTSVRIADWWPPSRRSSARAFNRTFRPSRTSRAASGCSCARSCRRAEPGGAATGAGADGARVAAERKGRRGGAGPGGPCADGRVAGRGALKCANRNCANRR